MGDFDADGRTPTAERGHRFDAKAGQYPLLRWQPKELRLKMGEISVELDIKDTNELVAQLAAGRVLLTDSGVHIRATTTFRHPETGSYWRTMSELRRGVMLNTGMLHDDAHNRNPGRAALLWPRLDPTDSAGVGTEYQLTKAGRVWAFDAEQLRGVLEASLEPQSDWFIPQQEDSRRFRFARRLRRIRRRVEVRAPSIDPFSWRASSRDEWVDVASKLEVLAHAADAYDLQPTERLALAREAEWLHVQDRQDLSRDGETRRRLHLMTPNTALWRTSSQSAAMLGPGSMVKFRALDNIRSGKNAATEDVRLHVLTADGSPSAHVLVWPERALRSLSTTSMWGGGWFARFMRQRLDLYDNAAEIVRALAADPLFAGVDPGRLGALLPGASTLRWAVGGPPPVPVGMAPGLIVLLQGDVVGYKLLPAIEDGSVRDLRLAPTHGYQVRPDRPKPVIGRTDTARAVLDGPGKHAVDGQIRARLPSRGVFLFARRFERVLGHDPAFLENCRSVVGHRLQVEQHRSVLASLDTRQGQFHDVLNVLFVGRASSARIEPLKAGAEDPDVGLLERLTEAIHGHFAERSVIVELVRGTASAIQRPGHACRDHVALQVPAGATDQEFHQALRHLADELVQRRDVVHVFLWSQREWPDSFAGAGDDVLLMSFDGTAPVPHYLEPDNSLMYAQFVPAGPHIVLPPGAVRLHMLVHEAPDQGWNSSAEALGRWARSVTQRRVGVALGGGGAWGWAHVALLRTMVNRDIPVDLVSGASFGAIAGSVFATAGKPGLTWAVEHAVEIQDAVRAAMFNGRRAEAYFDAVPFKMLHWAGRQWLDDVRSFDGSAADLAEVTRLFSEIGQPLTALGRGARRAPDPIVLGPTEVSERQRQLSVWRELVANLQSLRTGQGPLQLQHLPIPFFPVITELVAGSQSVILDRSVGFGVRASGALPPLFPVTRDSEHTYADGGLSQNVPANVVDLEGAALIVASNIVPPSLLTSPLRSGRWEGLSDLNPVQRAVAALVGVQTLFSSAGQVETGLAPIVFQTSWNGKMFFNVDKGAEIVKDTYSLRAFWQAMDGLGDRWDHLKRARRRDTPIDVI